MPFIGRSVSDWANTDQATVIGCGRDTSPNKTETAVHARHVASGLSVKVMAERSQLANKRLARALLAGKLAALAQTRQAQGRERAEWLPVSDDLPAVPVSLAVEHSCI
jgi:peptide chain release factor